MTENARFLFVIDNGEPVFYDLSKKGKMDMNETEDMLNELNEENKNLELICNYRGEMVSFATSLIQDMGSEEWLKTWNDFTEVMYQKWKKKRGIK